MIERLTSNNPLTKAIRIVLVFALVFWCSFRLECLAFGAVVVDDGSGHTDGTLSDAAVRSASGDGVIATVSSTASGKDGNITLSSIAGSQNYYIEPVWNDGSAGKDTLQATFFDWSSNDGCVSVEQGGDGIVSIRGVSGGTATVTCSLKSKFNKLVDPHFAEDHKGKAFEASISVTVVPPTASAIRLVGADGTELTSGGSITVGPDQRSAYAFSASVSMNDGVTGEAWNSFSTLNGSLSDQTGGIVSDPSWSIQSDDGTGAQIGADGVLSMSGPGTCVVWCEVNTANGIPMSSSVTVVSEPGPNEQTQPDNPDDPNKSEGSEDPSGSSGSADPSGSSGSADPGSSEGSENPSGPSSEKHMVLEDIDQGEDHAQDELRVVVVNATKDDASEESGEAADNGQQGQETSGEEGGSSNNSAESPTAEEGASSNAAEGDAPAGGDVSPQAEEEAPDNSSSSSSSSVSSAEGSFAIDKTYSVADLEALAAGTVTKYSMYGPNGWHTAQGTGPYLDVLLKDAGIKDTSQIVSVEFEGYGGTISIPWESLMATRSYFPGAPTGDFSYAENVHPMIATASSIFPNYVESDEPQSSDSGETPSGTSDDQQGEGGSAPAGDSGSSESPSADGDQQESSSAAAVAPQAEESASSEAADTAQGAPTGAGDAAGSGTSEGVDPAAEPAMVSNTRFRLLIGALSDPTGDVDQDSLRWINTIRVTLAPNDKSEEEPEPDTRLAVEVGYVPVPLGATAALVAIPNTEIGSSTFEFYWQYKTKDGEWEYVKDSAGSELMVQTLRVPTTEETVGRLYRVEMRADDPDTHERIKVHSDPVQIQEGSGFIVLLTYDPPYPGEVAIFSASAIGADPKEIEFVWEMSTDGCKTWQNMDKTATNAKEHKSQLYVPTSKQTTSSSSDGSSGSSESKPPVITYIHVVAKWKDLEAVSSPVLLTVQNKSGSSEGTGTGEPNSSDAEPKPETGKTDGGGEGADKSSQAAEPVTAPNESDTTSPSVVQPPNSQPTVTPPVTNTVPDTPAPTPTEPPENSAPSPEPTTPVPAETNTEQGAQPEKPSNLTPITIVPDSQNTTQFDPNQVYINSDVTEQVHAQKEEQQAKTPGARWTEISAVNPSSQDVRRILADNPFAPFALPLGLGIAVAGGLEKLLAFRRQL